MVLFDLQFSSPIEGAEKLFYFGDAELSGDALTVRHGKYVSFGSHFNLFPHAKYVKYCGLKTLTLTLRAEGRYELAFYHKSLKGETVAIASGVYENNASATVDLSRIPADGYVSFELKAITDTVIRGGSYESDVMPSRTKIGVVICTYKREKFVLRNLKTALCGMEKEPEWKDRLHFFVIDNAHTLKLPPSECYTVVPNKNLGGSGGFTRGITEVHKDGSYTHFLLMDDDILFTFELLKRTYNLAACFTDEHKDASVGGNMLMLEKPTVQYECGGYYNSGYRPHKRGVDLSLRENLTVDEDKSLANFNGWWYLLMPVGAVDGYGLPLPFFIKADDVEYGLRAIRELVLMNGLSVWHQNFEGKDGPVPRYYEARNTTAVNAIWNKRGRLITIARLVYYILKDLSVYDYGSAAARLQGYEDFFKGADFFRQTDAEKLNAEIAKYKPTYVSKEELERLCGADLSVTSGARKYKSGIAKVFCLIARNFLPRVFKKKQPTVFKATDYSVSETVPSKTAIAYDAERQQGCVYKYNRKLSRKLRHRMEKFALKILLGYGKMHKEYSKHYAELCTEQAWNERLGLN